jgi:hypothetical protein
MNPKANKIVSEMLDEQWEQWMGRMLADIRTRWIEDRTMARSTGYGKLEEPQMTPEQAKVAWKEAVPRYREWIMHDPKARELSGHYAGRISYEEMGELIRKAKLAAGEKV